MIFKKINNNIKQMVKYYKLIMIDIFNIFIYNTYISQYASLTSQNM